MTKRAIIMGATSGLGKGVALGPPDVPCHRVISSNGSIGAFHGQRDGEMIDKKLKLLQSEGVVL